MFKKQEYKCLPIIAQTRSQHNFFLISFIELHLFTHLWNITMAYVFSSFIFLGQNFVTFSRVSFFWVKIVYGFTQFHHKYVTYFHKKVKTSLYPRDFEMTYGQWETAVYPRDFKQRENYGFFGFISMKLEICGRKLIVKSNILNEIQDFSTLLGFLIRDFFLTVNISEAVILIFSDFHYFVTFSRVSFFWVKIVYGFTQFHHKYVTYFCLKTRVFGLFL